MSTKTKEGKYKRMRQRIAEGDMRDLIVPLDFLILEQLPKEGSTIGGVIPIAVTSRQLEAQAFSEQPEVAELVSGRLYSLKAAGLAVAIRLPRTTNHGWQVTKTGEKLLAKWRKENTNTTKEEK